LVKITAKDSGIGFAVRVQPRASRNGVAGEIDGALKIRLAAPPVDGEANEELIRFLAKLFAVSRQQVTIVSGQTSRNKMIRIEGKELDEAEKIILSALDG